MGKKSNIQGEKIHRPVIYITLFKHFELELNFVKN